MPQPDKEWGMDIPLEAIAFDEPREDEQASIATTSTTRNVYGRAQIVKVSPPNPSKGRRGRRVFYTLSKRQFCLIIALVSFCGALFLAVVVKWIIDLTHHTEQHVIETGSFTNGTTSEAWELVQMGGGCRLGNGLGGMLLGLGMLAGDLL